MSCAKTWESGVPNLTLFPALHRRHALARRRLPARRLRRRATQTVPTNSTTRIAGAYPSETEHTTGFAAARTALRRQITQASSPATSVVIPLKLRTMAVTVVSASNRTILVVLVASGALRIASVWTSSVHRVRQQHPARILVRAV